MSIDVNTIALNKTQINILLVAISDSIWYNNTCIRKAIIKDDSDCIKYYENKIVELSELKADILKQFNGSE